MKRIHLTPVDSRGVYAIGVGKDNTLYVQLKDKLGNPGTFVYAYAVSAEVLKAILDSVDDTNVSTGGLVFTMINEFKKSGNVADKIELSA